MNRKAGSGIMLTLLLIGMSIWTFNIHLFSVGLKTIYVDDDNITGPQP